jgi:hypothetical protein
MGGTCNTHEENENAYKILVRNPPMERPLGHLCVDRRVILKYILDKQFVKVWTDVN